MTDTQSVSVEQVLKRLTSVGVIWWRRDKFIDQLLHSFLSNTSKLSEYRENNWSWRQECWPGGNLLSIFQLRNVARPPTVPWSGATRRSNLWHFKGNWCFLLWRCHQTRHRPQLSLNYGCCSLTVDPASPSQLLLLAWLARAENINNFLFVV